MLSANNIQTVQVARFLAGGIRFYGIHYGKTPLPIASDSIYINVRKVGGTVADMWLPHQ